MPRAVGAVRPSQPDLLPVPLVPWALQCHNGRVTLDPWFHQAQLCHNGPLFPWGSTVSHWSLVSIIPCSVTGLSLVLQYHNGPLVPWGLTMAEGSPWFHEALQSPLIQRGLKVSPWPPGFHEAPQCHNGPLVPWVPALFHESLVPWGPVVAQWTFGSMKHVMP